MILTLDLRFYSSQSKRIHTICCILGGDLGFPQGIFEQNRKVMNLVNLANLVINSFG